MLSRFNILLIKASYIYYFQDYSRNYDQIIYKIKCKILSQSSRRIVG